MTDRIDELLAEVNKLTAQRDAARERARDAVDRNDAFVNELCMLIPDDRDDDVAAEAIIIGWVKELLARLKAAEDVCVLFGWTGALHTTDREKATQELWSRWCQLVGLVFAGDRSRIPDEEIARLAAQRDETRARTLAKIRSDAPTELAGGES